MVYYYSLLICNLFLIVEIGGVRYGAETSADLSIFFDVGGILGRFIFYSLVIFSSIIMILDALM